MVTFEKHQEGLCRCALSLQQLLRTCFIVQLCGFSLIRCGQRVLYLDEGDAIGGHGDVVTELVEELRRNPEGGAAKLKLVRPTTETCV